MYYKIQFNTLYRVSTRLKQQEEDEGVAGTQQDPDIVEWQRLDNINMFLPTKSVLPTPSTVPTQSADSDSDDEAALGHCRVQFTNTGVEFVPGTTMQSGSELNIRKVCGGVDCSRLVDRVRSDLVASKSVIAATSLTSHSSDRTNAFKDRQAGSRKMLKAESIFGWLRASSYNSELQVLQSSDFCDAFVLELDRIGWASTHVPVSSLLLKIVLYLIKKYIDEMKYFTDQKSNSDATIAGWNGDMFLVIRTIIQLLSQYSTPIDVFFQSQLDQLAKTPHYSTPYFLSYSDALQSLIVLTELFFDSLLDRSGSVLPDIFDEFQTAIPNLSRLSKSATQAAQSRMNVLGNVLVSSSRKCIFDRLYDILTECLFDSTTTGLDLGNPSESQDVTMEPVDSSSSQEENVDFVTMQYKMRYLWLASQVHEVLGDSSKAVQKLQECVEFAGIDEGLILGHW